MAVGPGANLPSRVGSPIDTLAAVRPRLERHLRSALAGLVKKPIRNDAELDLIAQRGEEHERVYIDRLREQGRSIADLSAERPEGANRG